MSHSSRSSITDRPSSFGHWKEHSFHARARTSNRYSHVECGDRTRDTASHGGRKTRTSLFLSDDGVVTADVEVVATRAKPRKPTSFSTRSNSKRREPQLEFIGASTNQREKDTKGTMIKISPHMPPVRLRGSDETWSCVERDYIMPGKCHGCGLDLFAIQDAEYVICPVCRSVSPFQGHCSPAGQDILSGGGVGLGFTYDNLRMWQLEIRYKRQYSFQAC